MSGTPIKRRSLLKSTNLFQSVKITDTLSKQRDVESGFRTINQYVVHQTLGEGSFAKVKLVHVTHSPNILYAMKVMYRGLNKSISDYLLSPLQPDQKQEELTINTEVAIMKKINHPNIVRLFEVIDDKSVNKLYMILELMKGGSCYKIGQQPLNEDDARSDMRDIIVGVSYSISY
ncbi:MAG: hypothetical protein EZS28_049620 [Streblomastix strix]|uniref:Protein kinase domain-containing protein n=1 Tax=Streblomastix strix TaxID=222440 RepID=A0A5J4TAJ1_9EUKA|nr:MAG: hypothetical protein EZS28_049620 [Streblomastix strix]